MSMDLLAGLHHREGGDLPQAKMVRDGTSTARAFVWSSKASVNRVLATMMDRKSACGRFRAHKTTSSAMRASRKVTSTAERKLRLCLMRRYEDAPNEGRLR